MIRTRRLVWVIHIGEIINAHKSFSRNNEGKRLLKDIGVHGRIILK
jgi:hypothetical protein